MIIFQNCFAECCFAIDRDSCSDDNVPYVPEGEHMTDIYGSNKS